MLWILRSYWTKIGSVLREYTDKKILPGEQMESVLRLTFILCSNWNLKKKSCDNSRKNICFKLKLASPSGFNPRVKSILTYGFTIATISGFFPFIYSIKVLLYISPYHPAFKTIEKYSQKKFKNMSGSHKKKQSKV